VTGVVTGVGSLSTGKGSDPLEATGTAGNLVADAHLAAIATEHAATVISFDADFLRFPGVRSQRPTA